MDKIETIGKGLMWYKCEKCGKKERIWNSRPGVTPFIIDCSDCAGAMQHDNFHLDEHAPNHHPEKGDRIFIDWTKEAAEQKYKKQIDQYWDDDNYPMSETFSSKDNALESLLLQWEPGSPTIKTVNSESYEFYKSFYDENRVKILQYDSLRKNFHKMVNTVLGSGYYNMGMDVYECDRLSCEDITIRVKGFWRNLFR